jgi:hypothetical protein
MAFQIPIDKHTVPIDYILHFADQISFCQDDILFFALFSLFCSHLL